MTYRILTPLKSLALSLSLKAFSKRRRKDTLEDTPEPIVWKASMAPVNASSDDWMFESAQEAFSHEVDALSGEMSRVSSALGSLRGVLSSLAAHAPVTDAVYAQTPMNAVWTEDALFEGEPMAHAQDSFAEDADLFLDAEYVPDEPVQYSQAA